MRQPNHVLGESCIVLAMTAVLWTGFCFANEAMRWSKKFLYWLFPLGQIQKAWVSGSAVLCQVSGAKHSIHIPAVSCLTGSYLDQFQTYIVAPDIPKILYSHCLILPSCPEKMHCPSWPHMLLIVGSLYSSIWGFTISRKIRLAKFFIDFFHICI